MNQKNVKTTTYLIYQIKQDLCIEFYFTCHRFNHFLGKKTCTINFSILIIFNHLFTKKIGDIKKSR